MKTVKDACEPHKLALDFALGDQIEDLKSAIGDERAGEAFVSVQVPTKRAT